MFNWRPQNFVTFRWSHHDRTRNISAYQQSVVFMENALDISVSTYKCNQIDFEQHGLCLTTLTFRSSLTRAHHLLQRCACSDCYITGNIEYPWTGHSFRSLVQYAVHCMLESGQQLDLHERRVQRSNARLSDPVLPNDISVI